MTYEACLKNLDKIEDILTNNFGGYPYTEEEEILLLTLDKARECVDCVKWCKGTSKEF